MITNFEQRMQDAVRQIKNFGMAYADAKAVSWQMQELRKVVLAEQIRKIESGTYASKDSQARTSDEYKLHLEGTREAIQSELKLRAQMEAAKASYESLRSLCSLQKKEVEAFEHETAEE